MPKRGRKRGGMKMLPSMGQVNNALRDSKFISGVVSQVNPMAGSVVSMAGYGPRNMKGQGRRGGWGWGSIGSILGNITRIPAMAAIGGISGAQGAIQQLGSGQRGGQALTQGPAGLMPGSNRLQVL